MKPWKPPTSLYRVGDKFRGAAGVNDGAAGHHRPHRFDEGGKKAPVGRRNREIDELIRRGEQLAITVFSIGELYVGVAKGNHAARERAKVEGALQPFSVAPFEVTTARIFGGLVGALEKRGQPISDMDALIASVALENDELLVTRNVRHFRRIPGLRVEGY